MTRSFWWCRLFHYKFWTAGDQWCGDQQYWWHMIECLKCDERILAFRKLKANHEPEDGKIMAVIKR